MSEQQATEAFEAAYALAVKESRPGTIKDIAHRCWQARAALAAQGVAELQCQLAESLRATPAQGALLAGDDPWENGTLGRDAAYAKRIVLSPAHRAKLRAAAGLTALAQQTDFPQPRQQSKPCGECHLQTGERCDICGAKEPSPSQAQQAEKIVRQLRATRDHYLFSGIDWLAFRDLLSAAALLIEGRAATRAAPAQAQHYATTDGIRCDNCGETLSAHTEGGRACPAPSQAQQAEPLTGCNCRWNGDEQVQWCELHAAHKEAIHEWAERAKTAEAKLAADWTDVRMELEAAGRDDLSRFVESATEPAQARRANSGSAS